MQFTSLAFALFLIPVFYLYWLAPVRYRRVILLLAGYIFYMTFSMPAMLLLLEISFIAYFTALSDKRSWHIIGIIIPVVTLMIFKYAHFIPSIGESVAVPVGVSFYFFKAISYIADVDKKKIQPEKDALNVFLYISFMPDLLAGPINRADKLIPQFKEEKQFSYESAVSGLMLILSGLFKKAVIADTLARYTSRVFDAPGAYRGLATLTVIIFYTIQIYFDFAGYSEMAVGVAALFNIGSMRNFKRPYFAADIGEFWERWHISLSSWLKDYVYIPLGGNRKGKMRTYVNLFITFIVSGMWHGGTLTFVLWGAIHGFYQAVHRVLKKTLMKEKKLPRVIGALITFILAGFAWIFFRANTLTDAFYMIRYSFYDFSPMLAYRKLGLNKADVALIVISILVVFIYEIYEEIKEGREKKEITVAGEVKSLPGILRYVIYAALTLTVLFVRLHGNGAQEFIYFKF